MLINIIEGINWDSENLENIEAREWINENVLHGDEVDPEIDKFSRPVKWSKETENAIITIEREYINPDGGSWAKKRDVITVEPKIKTNSKKR